jgi:hypothetical protein
MPVFSRLRVRLLALVLFAILPALGLVLFTAVEQRRGAKAEAEASAQRIAHLAAAAQKMHIEASRQLLIMLSQLRDIRPDRPDGHGRGDGRPLLGVDLLDERAGHAQQRRPGRDDHVRDPPARRDTSADARCLANAAY